MTLAEMEHREAVLGRLAEIDEELDSILDQDLSDPIAADRIVHLYWEGIRLKQKLARQLAAH